MGREIEFRAKSIDNQVEWLFGGISFSADGAAFIVNTGKDHLGYITIMKEVDRRTIGQYTGLKDKNGNRIFDGDIVAYCDCPASDYYRETEIANAGVILFDDAQFFVTNRQTVEMDDLVYDGTMDCEIIGNVYDNPDLAKEVE